MFLPIGDASPDNSNDESNASPARPPARPSARSTQKRNADDDLAELSDKIPAKLKITERTPKVEAARKKVRRGGSRGVTKGQSPARTSTPAKKPTKKRSATVASAATRTATSASEQTLVNRHKTKRNTVSEGSHATNAATPAKHPKAAIQGDYPGKYVLTPTRNNPKNENDSAGANGLLSLNNDAATLAKSTTKGETDEEHRTSKRNADEPLTTATHTKQNKVIKTERAGPKSSNARGQFVLPISKKKTKPKGKKSAKKDNAPLGANNNDSSTDAVNVSPVRRINLRSSDTK